MNNIPYHIRHSIDHMRAYVRFKKHIRRFDRVPAVCVVGAAGGFGKWSRLIKFGLAKGIAFEPDPDEHARLQRKYPEQTVFPYALAEEDTKKTFYITKSPVCSSLLKPLEEAVAPYEVSKAFAVRSTGVTDVRAFASLAHEHSIEAPDFLQIDVQGAETRVLEGFGDMLGHVYAVECETHLFPLYEGEEPLADLVAFMRRKGFVLCGLMAQGPFGGELVEFNAFFLKLLDPSDTYGRSVQSLFANTCGLRNSHGGIRKGLITIPS
jgi:FkbM family methyltransferase